MDDSVLALLRDQVAGIFIGAIFLFVGLAGSAIAAIRGRGGVRILVWFGIFNSMYGARLLAQTEAAFHVLPRSLWASRPYVIWIITYLILIPALLFWMELSLGRLRRILQITAILASLVGVAGVCFVIVTGHPDTFLYNNLLVIWSFLIVGIVNVIPRLAKKYLVVQSPVSAIGTMVLAIAVIYTNLKIFNLPSSNYLEPIAFAIFVFSLGYVTVEKLSADERRLLSIESELEVAREIQNSILPSGTPDLKRLRIHAAYLPMTAVAGDFYEFIPVDENRLGILVADVSGHGVPAALIAAMIKMAMQSVIACAEDPAAVLRGLNQSLSGQLRGQFVTAAYLWLDTEVGKGLYSAAGHPPLLLYRDGKMQSIESNGLLFGVTKHADYPVHELSLEVGDRFLLYTDGVVEAENAAGESFGDSKLEQVVRDNQSQSPGELSKRMLDEVRRWQPASVTQQDDITLLIVDVMQ